MLKCAKWNIISINLKEERFRICQLQRQNLRIIWGNTWHCLPKKIFTSAKMEKLLQNSATQINMNIVFDTCVIVDILQKREPFCEDAVNLLYAVSNQQINGIITAKSLTDIYYLLRKSLNEQAVRELLSNMTELFDIVDTTGADCKLALISDMKDYEDAIMVETAKRMKADGIVTRNLKDYQTEEVKIYSPGVLKQIIQELS